MLTAILSAIGVIVAIIITHELGHFITAKASGIKVDEFGLGFPPRLFSIRRGETLYSLNVIPLGGFVKIAGEEDPKVERSLASKRIGIRLMVLSAGSLMNVLLPLLLFSIAFIIPHDVVIGQVVVEGTAANSPAVEAGIKPGDTIISINNKEINSTLDLSRYIQLNLGKKTTFQVVRSDLSQKEIRLTPRWQPPQGEGAIGVAVRTLEPTIVSQNEPFWRAIPMGISQTIETLVLFKNGILSLLIGVVPIEVTGPIGIAQIATEVAKAGISPLLEFAAFLSINLAILNILPLPALDGGRIAFVLLEWVRRGKRISPKKEGLVHFVGLFMLMSLILVITYQDIVRIINGNSPIP
jgi:regulator of sigma E protease|tara:strand:- start:1041 stop:2099 length:1059 start_codon:yes stop_codon:yes gene_type:complete